MQKMIDMTGLKIGRLKVIKYIGCVNRCATWECLCDCGNTKNVRGVDLRRKDTVSCGCKRLEAQDHIMRIKESVVIDEITGCWNWSNYKSNLGYGRLKAQVGAMTKPKMISAHRYSYAALVGEIPEGLFVLHKCDNRACCNPDHLFLGTQKDNMQDMIAKGRHAWAKKDTPLYARKD